jgi:hypothetical protein
VLDDYLVRSRACRTENELNRLHVDLENVLAPQELAALARLVEPMGPLEKTTNWLRPFSTKFSKAPCPFDPFEHTTKWLNKLRRLSPKLFLAPHPFDRDPLHPNFTLYRGAAAPARRQLLFAFCGNAGRLLLPLPVFLQFLAPETWDVLVVRKRVKESYLTGLAGATGGPPSIVAIAKELVAFDQYRSVTCLGTSGGGYIAITAALLINAERGIAIGGALPREASKDYLVPADIVHAARTRLQYVHGADCKADSAAADAIARRYTGEVISVPDVARHNVLETLLQRDDVGRLLSLVGLTASA